MNMIAAVDENWALGYQNRLLVRIPEDMKYFKELTEHHVVVMGKNTLLSFPEGKPLKNRRNIVLTRDESFALSGAAVCHSLEEALEECKKYPADEIYIIGGASIYRQFLPLVSQVFLTRIHSSFQADAWFPRLEEGEEWKLEEESEEKTYSGISYQFTKYSRRRSCR